VSGGPRERRAPESDPPQSAVWIDKLPPLQWLNVVMILHSVQVVGRSWHYESPSLNNSPELRSLATRLCESGYT
jgi:hypothetical protein